MGAGLQTELPSFLIVGTPRSGTTLVQRLALELPGVAVPPETHFFAHFLPRMHRRRRFPLDDGALEEELRRFLALETSHGLPLDPALVKAELGGRCESSMRLFSAIVRSLSPPASVYGEKTPYHLLWWRPLSQAAPWLKFVCVVRDPRAVVASYRSTWGNEDLVVSAERWRLDQREMATLLMELGPQRSVLMNYEDVVRDPAAARATIARFLGLARTSHTRPVDDTILLHLPWETWKRRATRDITTGRIEAWREALNDDEAQQIMAICRDEMTRFGYADGGTMGNCERREVLARIELSKRSRFRSRRARQLATIRRVGVA